MCLKKILFAVLFLNVPLKTENARILGVIPIPSFSHQVVYRPLWRELSLRGHQLTVITSDPMNDSTLTNLTEIDIRGAYGKFNIDEVFAKHGANVLKAFDEINRVVLNVLEYELDHPEVQNLLKNESEHFDLVIVEYFLPIMFAFSNRFNCPFIGVLSMDAASVGHDCVGNPTHPVLYPDFQLPFVPPLKFHERLFSIIFYVFLKVYALLFHHKYEESYFKYFGKDSPPLKELVTNVSMLFINTNPVLHYVRPLGPATIQVGGGLHMLPLKELPKDLKPFLDDADQGVIYFSLGTNVGNTLIDDKLLSIFLETFKKLPYKILWKLNKNVSEKADNVKIVEWVPQQDVLRHPNIKLFITQGGLQSIEEAIYSYVPIVCLPFFVDQIGNCRTISERDYGLALDRHSLDKDGFKNAILEVITNSRYKTRIKEVVAISLDQPMTGLEKAVWWTEYVLRHKGAKHFKSHAVDIPLYQYLLLDVIGFLVLFVAVFVFLVVKVVRFVLKGFSKLFSGKRKLD